jgi:hypothetical protein
MPFGMGSAGWFFWPYLSYWMSQAYPYPWAPYPNPPYPGFLSEEQEVEFLESQAEILEEQLDRIRKRLDELKKKK